MTAPTRGCICIPADRRWDATPRCATCGQRVLEAQLTPVLLQILCGSTGLVLERNNIGFDDQRKIHYGVGGRGAGDYIGDYRGRYVEVEMKSADGWQTSEQRKRQVFIGRRGGIYAVVRCEADAHRLLEYLRSLSI